MPKRAQRLSPSNYERGSACTMSIKLSEQIPADRRAQTYDAAKGTREHELLELCIRDDLEVFELQPHVVEVDGIEVEIDWESLDSISRCLDWVRANAPTPWLLEHQIKLPFTKKYLDYELIGTVDLGCPNKKNLTVIDYKMGYNPVEATAPQLRIYLLGLALELVPSLQGHSGTMGRTVVLQPNGPGKLVSEAEYTWQDMRDLRDHIIETCQRLSLGDYTYQDGPWCKFCPALVTCDHLNALAHDPAMLATVPNIELLSKRQYSVKDLERALRLIPQLDAWIKAVHTTAETYAIHGGKLEGFKLTRARANRRWKYSPEETERKLVDLGVDPWKRTLISPKQAEDQLGKNRKGIINRELAMKPTGQLNLVPATHKGEEVNVAESFALAARQRQAQSYLTNANLPTEGDHK